MNGFAGELTQAAGSVGSLLKTDFCAGTPVTVFNSLEVARTDAVTLELPHWPKACARVYDPKGREVKSQVNRYENGTAELVFVATVPALGFAVYDVRPSDVPCRLRGSLSISGENQMENQKYVVRLNKKGNITSILDKEMDEQELLSEPISLGLFGIPDTVDLAVTSTAVVQNGDEFIRNMDLAVDVMDDLFDLKETFSGLRTICGKFNDFLGI